MADSQTLLRLAASAERITALHEELRAEKERRDDLIVIARDEHPRPTWQRIAIAARLSQSMCSAIVAELG